MKILFDLQHPAHLHFFRHVIQRLEREGHHILVTGRDKDILAQLAENYHIPLVLFGRARRGIFNLGKELLSRQWRLYKLIREFDPDLIMAVAGTFVSLPAKLRRIPVHIFYDTEHATISNLLAYPFAECIHVPQCYRKKIRWNHRRYNGYHELAYLHPNNFKPDISVLARVGVKPGELFTIFRFVGWGAGHDIGMSGLTDQNKLRVVRELSAFGKVFISCEGYLLPQLEKYRLKLDLTQIHSLMAYSSLIFGESATMTSEGAVLGVPGIYIDPVGRGYTDEQEQQYGIVFNFTHRRQDQAIQKGISILSGYRKEKWRSIGERITSEKIDVSEMIYNIATGNDKK